MGCILVVDDDPAFLRLIAAVLRFEGFDVQTASNGFDGLGMFQRENPSLILLDLHMPGMDGRAFFHAIESSPRPPVIILSAFGAQTACQELGAEWWAQKPFDPDSLLTTIRELLA